MAFARLLFAAGDLLILDEPTNHVDQKYYDWLASYLRHIESTVLVVSHHGGFVDMFADRILELEGDRGKLTEYFGKMATVQKEQAVRFVRSKKKLAKLEKEKNRLAKSAQKFRGGSSRRAKQVHVLQRRADDIKNQQKKIVQDEMPARQPTLKFCWPEMNSSARLVLRVSNIKKSYSRQLFPPLNFSLQRGQKLLIRGENGGLDVVAVGDFNCCAVNFFGPDRCPVESAVALQGEISGRWLNVEIRGMVGFDQPSGQDKTFAGGIYLKLTSAATLGDPGEKLALGQWLYFIKQSNSSQKIYIGSYLGAYVVSTGGCNQMTSNNAVDWNCNSWTVQNGWGVLYKEVTTPDQTLSYVVSDAYALIPTSNNSGDNSFAKAKIWSSAVGEGHKWEKVGDVTGKVGVELVLYNLANSDGVVVFGD